MDTPHIRITIGGSVALTVEQAAHRHHMQPSSMRALISRAQLVEDAMLDGRKRLYLAARIDDAVRLRPGKGANLRRAPEALAA